MKISIIFWIVFISNIGTSIYAQEKNPYEVRKEAIDKILVNINSNSPIKLDNVSEQIGAEYNQDKNIFSYKIRSIDRIVENIDIKLFSKIFSKHIYINSKKEPLTQALLQAKVIVEYKYFDKNYKPITSLKIYPDRIIN